jgi:DNA-binding XRE family transcriptional regulator
MNHTIGQKLKLYRTQTQMSQMDLEVAIDASFGSISRIETGRVNPTKETIISIAKVLRMQTREIADLFGIDTSNEHHLLKLVSELHKFNSRVSLCEFIVNKLTLHLGYLASLLLIKTGNTLTCRALTNNNISKNTFNILHKFLGVELQDISVSLERQSDGLLNKVVQSGAHEECRYTADFATPTIPKVFADMIQKVTGDKRYGIFPITSRNTTHGLLIFAKKIDQSYEAESESLYAITEQIGLAISSI